MMATMRDRDKGVVLAIASPPLYHIPLKQTPCQLPQFDISITTIGCTNSMIYLIIYQNKYPSTSSVSSRIDDRPSL